MKLPVHNNVLFPRDHAKKIDLSHPEPALREFLERMQELEMVVERTMKVITCSLLIATAAAQSVWVEAESATENTIQNNGWYSSVNKSELSGEDFLAHWGNQIGQAKYQIKVPKDGEYALWFRANPVASKLDVRIGEGKWTTVNFQKDSHENLNIASDKKPDLRFVAWVSAGRQSLKAGEQEVSVRFTSDNNHHGMLDCFCLTTDADWKPSRTLKPGEKPIHWPVPEITGANLDEWIKFVRPSTEELGWRAIRWHSSLSEAADEAKKLKRPILLWAMNGHPCGET
jgi:hypothetical protein